MSIPNTQKKMDAFAPIVLEIAGHTLIYKLFRNPHIYRYISWKNTFEYNFHGSSLGCEGIKVKKLKFCRYSIGCISNLIYLRLSNSNLIFVFVHSAEEMVLNH